MAPQVKAVRLHPDARTELRESVAFYRERAGERWAARFKQRIAEALTAIATNPERYAPVPGVLSVQRVRLKQFPFSLLYITRPDCVWVIAVVHGSRKPGYWKDRIS